MLTTLLLGLLHAAPPPTEGAEPVRIEGLRDTWVHPATWVPALRPGRPLPAGPAIIAVTLRHGEADAEAVADTLRDHEDVQRVEAKEDHLLVFLTHWRDLSTAPLPDGRTLIEVADIAIVPRPRPVALPGSSVSPYRPPGPTPRAPVEPWNLVIHNPFLGGPARLSVESLALGQADPDATIVIHDVVPGIYAVTIETPLGAKRTLAIATQKAAE